MAKTWPARFFSHTVVAYYFRELNLFLIGALSCIFYLFAFSAAGVRGGLAGRHLTRSWHHDVSWRTRRAGTLGHGHGPTARVELFSSSSRDAGTLACPHLQSGNVFFLTGIFFSSFLLPCLCFSHAQIMTYASTWYRGDAMRRPEPGPTIHSFISSLCEIYFCIRVFCAKKTKQE